MLLVKPHPAADVYVALTYERPVRPNFLTEDLPVHHCGYRLLSVLSLTEFNQRVSLDIASPSIQVQVQVRDAPEVFEYIPDIFLLGFVMNPRDKYDPTFNGYDAGVYGLLTGSTYILRALPLQSSHLVIRKFPLSPRIAYQRPWLPRIYYSGIECRLEYTIIRYASSRYSKEN